MKMAALPDMASPPTLKFAPAEFIFGFNLVAGIGTSFGEPTTWPLSDAQLAVLRDQIGINSIRFFVHPNFVGLPQKTFNGPEAFKYSAYKPSDYVWDRPETSALDSLDEFVRKMYSSGLEPMLQPMVPAEHVNWIYDSDITFLNAKNGVDYTGFVPADEVQSFLVTIAAHMQQTFGKPFLLNLTEICGQNADGPALRSKEQPTWQRIRDAVKAAAPLAEFQGPEICINNTWAWTEIKDGCGKFSPYYAGSDAPPNDSLGNYAQTFGVLEISGGLLSQQQVTPLCPMLTRLRASTDQHTFVTRDQAMPQKWMLAETSWASAPSLDEQHLNWAAFLFGLDHARGLFVWDAKNTPAEEAPGGMPDHPGLWSSRDVPSAALQDWVTLGPIIGANRNFFGTYHSIINNDGLATDSMQFGDSDPAVVARKLEKHVVVFSTGPTQVTLTPTDGATLTTAYAGGAAPVIQASSGSITISGLVPNRIYIFAIGS
jgi:hypothetical protein